MIERPSRSARVASVVLGAALAVALGGCSRVAAYERGRLAHPSMSARQRMGAGQAHLYAIREGARGGSLGAGSGCGCN
jgi:hypothetical protein